MTSTYSKSHVALGRCGTPLFASHGDGGKIYDVDGNDYVDMSMGLGAVILGYRDPDVDEAIRRQMDSGISFSLGTEIEAELCALLAETFGPHVVGGKDEAMVALGKNGSDATALAVRLARTVTGDRAVHMHSRGYHGWHDWSLNGTSRGAGTVLPDFIFDEIAASIVEPDVEPAVHELRKTCDDNYRILIFDEIVTGLRYPGLCAASALGIKPDILCLGKGLGNGMPISAVICRREIMRRIAPGCQQNCFWSGTMFGETLSIAAAIATITKLKKEASDDLEAKIAVVHGTAAHALKKTRCGIAIGQSPLNRLIFPSPAIAGAFRRGMAANGVLIYGAHMVCAAHTSHDINRLERAYAAVLPNLGKWTVAGEDTESGIMRR